MISYEAHARYYPAGKQWRVAVTADGRTATATGPTFAGARRAAMVALVAMKELSSTGRLMLQGGSA